MNEILSINPATLEELDRTPITPEGKVREYVAAARAAAPLWHRMGFKARGEYLLRARDHIIKNIDDIAKTITLENGKPISEAISAEILPLVDLIYYFSKNAESILYSYELPIGIYRLLRRRSRISYQPMGVVAVISPSNYPLSIPVGHIIMALICGNAVLFKPSESATLVGKKIDEIFEAAGLPTGIFHFIPGDASTGAALVASHLDKLIFTGSAETGRTVMRSCADSVTPLVLELGGKDAAIIRADADLDLASSGVVWGAFTNAGQCCASIERAYVHESILDEFVEMCVRKAMALKIGNGLNDQTDIGPLISKNRLAHISQHVEDARSRGAKILCGGERATELPGYFYKPTIITGCDHSFQCVRDESFGPILPIMPYSDERQVIKLVNDNIYGLTASIWTSNIEQGEELAREIRVGTVTINDCLYTHAICETPWGGRKGSGFGRSHGKLGLLELVTPHHMHTNRSKRKNIWWFRYDSGFTKRFKSLAKNLLGPIHKKLLAIPQLIKSIRSERL